MPRVRMPSAVATKSDLRVLLAEIIGAVALLLLAHLGAVYALLR